GRGGAHLALWLVALGTPYPMRADAQAMRRLFEPTDTEMEDPGVAEIDMQFGVVRGQDAYRIAAPDAEIDLGLTADIEFDLDGQFAIGGPDSGELPFNHLAPHKLWPALKTGGRDI